VAGFLKEALGCRKKSDQKNQLLAWREKRCESSAAKWVLLVGKKRAKSRRGPSGGGSCSERMFRTVRSARGVGAQVPRGSFEGAVQLGRRSPESTKPRQEKSQKRRPWEEYRVVGGGSGEAPGEREQILSRKKRGNYKQIDHIMIGSPSKEAESLLSSKVSPSRGLIALAFPDVGIPGRKGCSKSSQGSSFKKKKKESSTFQRLRRKKT